MYMEARFADDNLSIIPLNQHLQGMGKASSIREKAIYDTGSSF